MSHEGFAAIMFAMQRAYRKAQVFIRHKKSVRVAFGAPGIIKTLLACVIVLSTLKYAFQSQEDGILIYVPVHQASVKNLVDFASCMTRARPVLRGEKSRRRVDLLIVTNGDHHMDQKGAEDVQRALRSLKHGIPQIARVRHRFDIWGWSWNKSFPPHLLTLIATHPFTHHRYARRT